MVDEMELSFPADARLSAWRLFRVRRLADGYALGAPMIHGPAPPPWRTGVEVARCLEHDHAAPAAGCRCGIYGAVEGTLDSIPAYLYDTAYDGDPWAFAEIACSGRLFVDVRGVRCQQARLLRVAAAEASFETAPDRTGALAARYGVPVETSAAAPPWLTGNAPEQVAPPDLPALVRRLVATGPG